MEDEKLYNFDIPVFDFKELIKLKKFDIDLDFEEGFYPELRAELLINYIDKLEKAEKLVSAYKKAVETILKDLPADMVIENNKGICYRIIKKCDKDYLSFYSNSVLRSNK